MKKFLAAALFLLGVAGAVGYYQWSRPYAAFEGHVFVQIPKGTSTPEIAMMLERNGVIRSRWLFLATRALRPKATLQAGEYLFSSAATPGNVFNRLVSGDVFYYELVVPEGSNVFDISKAVAKLDFITAEEFLEAAADPSAIRDLAPDAVSLEGYLFPSTYRLTRGTTAEQLCRQMVEQFRHVWAELKASEGVRETVTLASLIEKETGMDRERATISSVFHNRLERGIKLDCDPTAIYAAMLENRYRGTIYRSDLNSKHRYNTYQHAGLPPGPIANPGVESLRAALDPVESKFIYFVASPAADGSHQFSETLAQHQRAVARYKSAHNKRLQAQRSGANLNAKEAPSH